MGSANADGSEFSGWTELAEKSWAAPAIAWNPETGRFQLAVRGETTAQPLVVSVNADGSGLGVWTALTGATSDAPSITWDSTAGKLEIAEGGRQHQHLHLQRAWAAAADRPVGLLW